MPNLEVLRCFARECQPGACGGVHGWMKEYLWHEGHCWPLIVLFVKDAGGIYSDFLPFVVDTGASTTLIPRSILPREAFQQPVNNEPFEIRGIGHTLVAGQRHKASLSITPRQETCAVLSFDDVHVVVSEKVSCRHGLLGLDALRQIITTFDDSGMRFRKPQPSQGA